MCKCCGNRNCCAPIIPVTGKAKTMNTGLAVILACHFVVLFIKVYLMGIFSGLSDLTAIVVLIVGLVRYDFCLVITYIVINLVELFSLIVVLGFYLQTDMGKNAPGAKKEGEEQQKIGKNSIGHSKSSKSGIHIVFRGLFDKILQMKYSFYQNWSSSDDKIGTNGTFLA